MDIVNFQLSIGSGSAMKIRRLLTFTAIASVVSLTNVAAAQEPPVPAPTSTSSPYGLQEEAANQRIKLYDAIGDPSSQNERLGSSPAPRSIAEIRQARAMYLFRAADGANRIQSMDGRSSTATLLECRADDSKPLRRPDAVRPALRLPPIKRVSSYGVAVTPLSASSNIPPRRPIPVGPWCGASCRA